MFWNKPPPNSPNYANCLQHKQQGIRHNEIKWPHYSWPTSSFLCLLTILSVYSPLLKLSLICTNRWNRALEEEWECVRVRVRACVCVRVCESVRKQSGGMNIPRVQMVQSWDWQKDYLGLESWDWAEQRPFLLTCWSYEPLMHKVN